MTVFGITGPFGCLRFMGMAWFLAAIAGIPVVLVTAWGLAGGYSFRYLPFLLVPYAIPLVVAPLIAGFLTSLRPGRSSDAVALGIALLCAGASGLAVLAVGFTIPFSLLDDSGHAIDNLSSLVVAELVVITYLVAAIVSVVFFAARVKAGPPYRSPDRTNLLRRSGVVAGGMALLLLLGGVAGVAYASRLDRAGIPIEPGDTWMASRPESTMTYPGAALSGTAAGGEEKQLSHTGPAEGGTTFYTADPPLSVEGWFTQRLLARGWRPTEIIGGGEDQSWAFKRGDRELFVIRYYKPSSRFANHAQHPGEGFFWTTYSVYPSGETHI